MRKPAFTLLEIVLAIGLMGAVLTLLTTAIHQYMLRVDTNRAQVESSQLARMLLKRIASDIRAARYSAPAGATSPGQSGSSSLIDASSSEVQGLFGTETELRIDRGAIWNWERLTREITLSSNVRSEELPQTVRYFYGDGKELLRQDFAATGITDRPQDTSRAGLYREQYIQGSQKSVIGFQGTGTGTGTGNSQQSSVELLAPEVAEIKFAYFDGITLLNAWNCEQNEGLPRGIEIRLKILEQPLDNNEDRQRYDARELREDPDNLKEYRLFVHLPGVKLNTDDSDGSSTNFGGNGNSNDSDASGDSTT